MQISNKSPRLNLFRTLVFLFAFLSSPYAFAEGKPLPPQCTDLCDVPYGEVLGVTRDGTTSYSNCQADCVVFDPNQEQGTYSGIKWQCVEYARRWLIRNRGITFGDVDVAECDAVVAKITQAFACEQGVYGWGGHAGNGKIGCPVESLLRDVWARLNQVESVTVGPAMARIYEIDEKTLEIEAGFPVASSVWLPFSAIS